MRGLSKPILLLAAAVVLVSGSFVATNRWSPMRWSDSEGWASIAWPFPKDGFAPGQAWRKGTLEVYVRPKFGLCGNCDTGVVTDEEVDRVTDIDFVDARFKPLADGNQIRFADLPGRARLYAVNRRSARQAQAIAVASKCDLVVAVIVGGLENEAVLQSAHAFLESDEVRSFVKQRLQNR